MQLVPSKLPCTSRCSKLYTKKSSFFKISAFFIENLEIACFSQFDIHNLINTAAAARIKPRHWSFSYFLTYTLFSRFFFLSYSCVCYIHPTPVFRLNHCYCYYILILSFLFFDSQTGFGVRSCNSLMILIIGCIA